MRALIVSAMNTLPRPSTTTPRGWLSRADWAGPPSPEKSAAPVPATVVMTPDGSIRRMRLLLSSAM